MYCLSMNGVYLSEIMSGIKKQDVRLYDTSVRGIIGLIDSRKKAIIGIATLVSTHRITYREYYQWHCTGPWKNSTIPEDIDEGPLCFAYELENPQYLAKPIKVQGQLKTWTKINDLNPKDLLVQERIF